MRQTHARATRQPQELVVGHVIEHCNFRSQISRKRATQTEQTGAALSYARFIDALASAAHARLARSYRSTSPDVRGRRSIATHHPRGCVMPVQTCPDCGAPAPQLLPAVSRASAADDYYRCSKRAAVFVQRKDQPDAAPVIVRPGRTAR